MNAPIAIPNAFCSYCGQRHTADTFPKTCTACGQVTYVNPLPVAVALVPVKIGIQPIGLLLVQRGIEPKRGEWALPGGFMERGETWEHAVWRETFEETGISINEASVRLYDQGTTPNSNLLVFGVCDPIDADALLGFEAHGETMGLSALRTVNELAFPMHTRAAHRWLREHRLV
jgi:ADP-ribose pyrophosphatase YjhB (NUDIX family)